MAGVLGVGKIDTTVSGCVRHDRLVIVSSWLPDHVICIQVGMDPTGILADIMFIIWIVRV